MVDRFLSFIKDKKLFRQKDTVLLAVSGGMDSSVMAELFHRANFKFAIAHCNFQLRGKESDGDEQFVKSLAKKYGVRFFTKRFNTKEAAAENKISIQMAARELRYHWFEKLVEKEGYACVATAHHLSDSVETFFINLLRGTGIEGITGIEGKNKFIIRPLLFATRDEIEKFAMINTIGYREDSSNRSDDYLRNKIRHHLIPVFKTFNLNFEEVMANNMLHFGFAADLFRQQVTGLSAKYLKKGKDFLSISMKSLRKQDDADQLLYEILRPFGFNFSQCVEMIDDESETKSGRLFLADYFRAVRDRQRIIIDIIPLKTAGEFVVQKAKKKTVTPHFNLHTTLATKGRNGAFPPDQAGHWLDADLLKFPITLRKWENGDFFYPLGMKGRKKLSDFFIDKKLSIFDKENTFVLVSGSEIVCILGHRIDERFKVTDKTKNIYKVEVKKP